MRENERENVLSFLSALKFVLEKVLSEKKKSSGEKEKTQIIMSTQRNGGDGWVDA